jgi:hypothetical protein
VTPAPPCRRALAVGLVAVTLGTLGLAACDRGGRGGDTATFCADVGDNVDYLRFADFQNLEQVDTIIDLYTKIGAKAPLEIETDWDAIVLELRTVRDTDLTDAEAVEEMYSRIFATEPSYLAVADWLQVNCDVDLGPVVTIVSHDASATASTSTTVPD